MSAIDPNWQSLSDINFLLYNRLADSLNAALSAMALAQMAESTGQAPEWWYQRGKSQIEGVLNLVMSWSWLIQSKVGSDIPEKALQPFRLQSLLDWVTLHLKLVPPLITEEDVLLHANQHTVQEALLLLYSVAATQGAGVNILISHFSAGVLFRIRFVRPHHAKKSQRSIDELIQQQGSHWRQQIIAFELGIARDFLRMNQIELQLQENGSVSDFCFTLYKPGQHPQLLSSLPTELHRQQSISHIINATIPAKHSPAPLVADQGVTRPIMSHNRQHWHIPPAHLRADPSLFAPKIKAPPDQIPVVPVREGGWHLPIRRYKNNENDHTLVASPIIVGLDLPDPVLPKFLRDISQARETANLHRLEPEDKHPSEHELKNDRLASAGRNHKKELP